MKNKLKRKQGQAMVEYIIIVAVIAVAALVLFGMFGDTIKKKMGGAVDALDGGSEGAAAAAQKNSVQELEDLGNTE